MLLVADQRTDAWHEARKGLITASMAAACLGLDPYQSRQKAWRRIMGTEVQQDNDHMRHGRLHEADAIAELEINLGMVVQKAGLYVHDKHQWLGASPDGLLADAVVEAKCPSRMPESISETHAIQMAVQMAVLDKPRALYVVWLPDDFKVWELKRNMELEQELLKNLEVFWKEHIFNNTEPKRKRNAEQSNDHGSSGERSGGTSSRATSGRIVFRRDDGEMEGR